jgi:hypothetical protein
VCCCAAWVCVACTLALIGQPHCASHPISSRIGRPDSDSYLAHHRRRPRSPFIRQPAPLRPVEPHHTRCQFCLGRFIIRWLGASAKRRACRLGLNKTTGCASAEFAKPAARKFVGPEILLTDCIRKLGDRRAKGTGDAHTRHSSTGTALDRWMRTATVTHIRDTA